MKLQTNSRGTIQTIMAQTELAGLVELKAAVDSRIQVLTSLVGGVRQVDYMTPVSGGAKAAKVPATGRTRTMSETVRKRIAAAQKKRWADYRKEQLETRQREDERKRTAALQQATPPKRRATRKSAAQSSAPAPARVAVAAEPDGIDFSEMTAGEQ